MAIGSTTSDNPFGGFEYDDIVRKQMLAALDQSRAGSTRVDDPNAPQSTTQPVPGSTSEVATSPAPATDKKTGFAPTGDFQYGPKTYEGTFNNIQGFDQTKLNDPAETNLKYITARSTAGLDPNDPNSMAELIKRLQEQGIQAGMGAGGEQDMLNLAGTAGPIDVRNGDPGKQGWWWGTTTPSDTQYYYGDSPEAMGIGGGEEGGAGGGEGGGGGGGLGGLGMGTAGGPFGAEANPNIVSVLNQLANNPGAWRDMLLMALNG